MVYYPRFKTFEGKTYHLAFVLSKTEKRKAKFRVRQSRKEGYSARLVEVEDAILVYTKARKRRR